MTRRAHFPLFTAALFALLLPAPALATTQANAPADPTLQPVNVTAAAGVLAARVSPSPALVTGAADTGGTVRIDNTSTLAEHVTIGASDYSVDAAGTPVPAPPDFEFGSASWYRFDAVDFQLPSGMSKRLHFDLVVPGDAAAGDHVAALNVVVAPLDPSTASGVSARSVLHFQTRLQHRIAGAIPGTPNVALVAVDGDAAVDFTARVENTGTTVLGHQAEPLPTITLYSTLPWGDASHPDRTLPLRGFYVAPRAVRDVALAWTDVPLLGSYRAVFTLPAADGLPAVTAETTFTVVNLRSLAILGAAGAIGLFLMIVAALRRRRRAVRRTLPPTDCTVDPSR